MKNTLLNLWELTRTDNIPNFYKETHEFDCKKIAADVRKHLRKRFPFLKWSVRSGYNEVRVEVKESPFPKESAVMAEIVKYAMAYTNAWNYDNSDITTDYFDVNFYTNYERNILGYDYTEREKTETERVMEEKFLENKKQAEKEEKERKERLFQEFHRTEKIRRRLAEQQRKIDAENQEKIEESAVIKDVDYFLIGCVDEETLAKKPEKVRISREVHLPKEEYKAFTHLRAENFSFLDGMGGSVTDDNRLNDDIDLEYMTSEEKESLEWYLTNCVAIYCENELKFVVDPEGFSYCRYILSVDNAKKINVEERVFEETELNSDGETDSELAEMLADVSTEIIMENNMLTTWNTTDYEKYKLYMKEWINEMDFPLSVEVIREIKDLPKFKKVMYKILNECTSIQEQFKKADFKENEEMTIISYSYPEFGGTVRASHMKFKDLYYQNYAQHDDAVKLICRPEGKRKDYCRWIYSDCLVYKGYVDIPDDLLWETTGFGGRLQKYASFDKDQYRDIVEYFNKEGIKPVVNTLLRRTA